MDRLELWKHGELRGANAFPRHTVEDLKTLRSWGANLVSYGIESTVEFEPPFGVREEQMARVEGALARAKEAGLFATINFRSAPGREDFNRDLRQFQDLKYHDGFARMWRETAQRLKGNDIVAGYDLMCEPHPEDVLRDVPRQKMGEAMKGTPADWNALAKKATEAIREVDADTPIIVNSTGWAYPHTFGYLELTGDPRTVYSVHFYSPRPYTHQRPNKPVTYPGVVSAHVEPEQHWCLEVMVQTLKPVRDFQTEHHVPIFAGEFGCARYAPGVEQFFRDQIGTYEDWGWSWAYWDLRGWQVMDIEMTADPEDRTRYPDTPLLNLFKSYFARCKVWPDL